MAGIGLLPVVTPGLLKWGRSIDKYGEIEPKVPGPIENAVKNKMVQRYAKQNLEFNQATIFTEEEYKNLSDKVAKIHSSNISDEQKIIATSQAYVDARIAKLPVGQQQQVRDIVANAKPGYSSTTNTKTLEITIYNKSTREMLSYHDALVHELEHITQLLDPEKRYKALHLIDKIISSGMSAPRSKMEAEAIGAEWDLLNLLPGEFIIRSIEEAEKRVPKAFKGVDFFNNIEGASFDLTQLKAASSMDRASFIQYARDHTNGYSAEAFADQDWKRYQEFKLYSQFAARVVQVFTVASALYEVSKHGNEIKSEVGSAMGIKPSQ